MNSFTLEACIRDISKHKFECKHCNLYYLSNIITTTNTDLAPTSLLLCGNKVLTHVIILVQTGLVFQLISDVQHSHSTGSQHCPQHSHSIMSSTWRIFINTLRPYSWCRQAWYFSLSPMYSIHIPQAANIAHNTHTALWAPHGGSSLTHWGLTPGADRPGISAYLRCTAFTFHRQPTLPTTLTQHYELHREDLH